MDKLPCALCKGLCCGPVSVTEDELKKIKKRIKAMPIKIREKLRNQKRYTGTCIFYDIERNRCGIYSSRPMVCKMFGYYKGMACFKNPD
ncbi:YkgJ family cysteine cluster protein, partial [Bacillus thuringiensis]|nr:YkgJ family cysteine cluster protein [Bacillus thuringiensis]